MVTGHKMKIIFSQTNIDRKIKQFHLIYFCVTTRDGEVSYLYAVYNIIILFKSIMIQ